MQLAPPTKGKYILALDPGGTTGIAIRLQDGAWDTSTTRDPQELWTFFTSTKPDAVVFELFSTMGRVDKYMLHTVELVGGIKALCHALDIDGYAHVPQNRYGFLEAAEDMLRARRRPFVVHEKDALAHLLAWEYRMANKPTMKARVRLPSKVRGKL